MDFGQVPNGQVATQVRRFENPHGRSVGFRLSYFLVKKSGLKPLQDNGLRS